jgi:hypothetical protein
MTDPQALKALHEFILEWLLKTYSSVSWSIRRSGGQ